MIKAVDSMHLRGKLVRVGMSCMGQQLAGAYRTLKDEETGTQFCMMMYWASPGKSISYSVQATDELMHLFFEDVPNDWEREKELQENGGLELPEAVTESKAYQRVEDQLFRAVCKKMDSLGYAVDEEMNVTLKAEN